MGDTTVLAREMFSSGFRARACLSSLLSTGPFGDQIDETTIYSLSLDSEITDSVPSSERGCLRPIDQPCITLFYDSLTFSSSSTIVGGILPLTKPSKSCTGEGGGIRWFKSFHGRRSKYENVNALVSLCDNER